MDNSTARFVRKWRKVSQRKARPAVIAFRKLQKHPQPDKAIVQLQEYLRKWPKDALAHYSLGILLLNVRQDPKNAIKEISMALAEKPTDGFFHVDLALALLALRTERGNKDALRTALRATELEPHSGEPWCALGAAYGQSQKVYESIRAFKKSLFYDSDQPGVHRNLGLLFRRLSQKRDAAEHYRQSLVLDPYNRQAYINYTNVLISLRKTGEAGRVLEEMTKFFVGKQKKLPVLLPRVQLVQQRMKEAEEMFKTRKKR